MYVHIYVYILYILYNYNVLLIFLGRGTKTEVINITWAKFWVNDDANIRVSKIQWIVIVNTDYVVPQIKNNQRITENYIKNSPEFLLWKL